MASKYFNFFNSLKPDFSNEDAIWLIGTKSLRKLVGILGIALPFLLFGFLYLSSGYYHPLESISHYYYTRVSSIFQITVSLMGVFLIMYKGHKPIDFYLSTLAGFGALLLVLFPTSNLADCPCLCHQNPYIAVTYIQSNPIREKLHFVFAAIFLVSLMYMSLFLFTKTQEGVVPSKKKLYRNTIYISCGIVMAMAFVVVTLGALKVINPDCYKQLHLTFWMETIAIESFGLSWLVKGDTIFSD